VGDFLCRAATHGASPRLHKEVAENTQTRFGNRRKAKKGDHIVMDKKGRIGSSFDDFLKEEGAYEETPAVAIKRVLAW
jgi:hypothetical protein